MRKLNDLTHALCSARAGGGGLMVGDALRPDYHLIRAESGALKG
jgi:hypothetical protein